LIARVRLSALRLASALGAWLVTFTEYAGGLAVLLQHTLSGSLRKPPRFSSVVYELWRVGAQSTFIVFISSFFIGMVLTFQSAYQMQKLAAEMYIPSLVALSVVREIGPVMTALIIAGRVGSAIAAELGTMRVTEQLDALRALATDPVRYLVAPRLIALLVAAPVLTVWANATGVFGGFLIGTLKLGILPSLYWKMTTYPLVLKDLTQGLIKAVVFGALICIVSCYEGFRTEGGAEGVGRSTTLAVVTSFILIIAADCLITAMFYFIWR
jgi:phospholipid/cholesterol/gamma-HCH transport system permease protein